MQRAEKSLLGEGMRGATSGYRLSLRILLALMAVVFTVLAAQAVPSLTDAGVAGTKGSETEIPGKENTPESSTEKLTTLQVPAAVLSPAAASAPTIITLTLAELLNVGTTQVSFLAHGISQETIAYRIQIPPEVKITERTTGMSFEAYARFLKVYDSQLTIDTARSEVVTSAGAPTAIYLRSKGREQYVLSSNGVLSRTGNDNELFKPLQLTERAVEILLKSKPSETSPISPSPIIEYVASSSSAASADRNAQRKSKPEDSEILIAVPAGRSDDYRDRQFVLKLEFDVTPPNTRNKTTTSADSSANSKNPPKVPLDLLFQRPVPRQTVDGPGGPSTGTPPPGATGSPSATPGTVTPGPSGTVTPGGTITPGSTVSPSPSGTVTPKATGSVTTTPVATASSTSSPVSTGGPTGTVTPNPSGTTTPEPSGTVTPGGTTTPNGTDTPDPPGGTGTITPPVGPSGTVTPDPSATGTAPPGRPGTGGPTPVPSGTVTPPVAPSPSRTVPPGVTVTPGTTCGDPDTVNARGRAGGCANDNLACCLANEDQREYGCIPLYSAPADRYLQNRYPYCLNNCNSYNIGKTTDVCPFGQVCCTNQLEQPQCQFGSSCGDRCTQSAIGRTDVCPGEQLCCYNAQGRPQCLSRSACYSTGCDKTKQNLLGRAGGCEDSRYACCNESRYGQQFKCVPQGHGYPHPENGNTAPNCLPYVPGTYPPTVSPSPSATPECECRLTEEAAKSGCSGDPHGEMFFIGGPCAEETVCPIDPPR